MSYKGYINVIKDIYDGAMFLWFDNWLGKWVNSQLEYDYTRGVPRLFSPYLFALVMDELTRHIEYDVPWCMLFADDIVLVDETAKGVNAKLEI